MNPQIRVAVPFLALLLFGIGSPMSTAVGQQRRDPAVGWFDLQRVLQQTPGYAAAESTFTREMRSLQRDLETRRTRVDSMIGAFGQQAAGMAAAARQARQAEIQKLSQELEKRGIDIQDRAQRRQQELLSPIEQRVRAVVQGVRAERNLAMIIDVSIPGMFIAVDPALDLTSVVVQRLRTAQ